MVWGVLTQKKPFAGKFDVLWVVLEFSALSPIDKHASWRTTPGLRACPPNSYSLVWQTLLSSQILSTNVSPPVCSVVKAEPMLPQGPPLCTVWLLLEFAVRTQISAWPAQTADTCVASEEQRRAKPTGWQLHCFQKWLLCRGVL